MSEASEAVDNLIIGGGQAGLTVAYYLKKHKRPFVILDANARIGDAWRNRWNSLRLFTPARFTGLPGMRFPKSGGSYPTKDEMADYLEAYATHFGLPVRTGVKVDQVSRSGDGFLIRAGADTFEARNVIVAMSNFQQPKIPAFASELSPRIVQLHSQAYRNPSQLKPGRVLVVGAGNSGADIAIEVAQTHATTLAGAPSAVIPFRIEPFFARNVAIRIVRFVGQHVLSLRTPIGRKARPRFVTQATPLIRVKPKDLEQAGIERTGRIIGVVDGMPVADDGRASEVDNIIWCTGFRPGFSWIDLPVLADRQEPLQKWGIVPEQPGLYFVGLEFQYAATSATVTGVARDAHRVVRHIARRELTTVSAPSAREATDRAVA